MYTLPASSFFFGGGGGGWIRGGEEWWWAGVTVFTFNATCLATMQQNCEISCRKNVDVVSFFSLQSFPLLKSHPYIDSIIIENDASF